LDFEIEVEPETAATAVRTNTLPGDDESEESESIVDTASLSKSQVKEATPVQRPQSEVQPKAKESWKGPDLSHQVSQAKLEVSELQRQAEELKHRLADLEGKNADLMKEIEHKNHEL